MDYHHIHIHSPYTKQILRTSKMKQGKNKTQKNEEEIPMNVTYEPNKSSKEKNTKLAGDQKTINKEIPSLMAFFFSFSPFIFPKISRPLRADKMDSRFICSLTSLLLRLPLLYRNRAGKPYSSTYQDTDKTGLAMTKDI